VKRSLKSTVARTGSKPLAKLFGGGEAGKKLADYVGAINNGLPPPKMEWSAGKKPARKPPGQTQSNQARRFDRRIISARHNSALLFARNAIAMWGSKQRTC
jgi:hypothetical protein